MRQGQSYNLYNNIYLFSNAIKEGLRGDINVMRGENPGDQGAPREPSLFGYMWKTIKLNFLPKLFVWGLTGLLSAAGFETWKKWRKAIGKYDLTNYNIIPLGMEGEKAVYLRVPQDEMGRFFSGLAISFVKGNLGDTFSFAAGQAPNLTPWLELAMDYGQYLSGRNPYSFFRQGNVMDKTTFAAGGKDAAWAMFAHTMNTLGAPILYRFSTYEDLSPKGQLERAMGAPVISNLLGRFIKVSDQGVKETVGNMADEMIQASAQEALREQEAIVAHIRDGKGKSKLDGKRLFFQLVKDGRIDAKTAREKRRKLAGFMSRWKHFQVRGTEDPAVRALGRFPNYQRKEIQKELE